MYPNYTNEFTLAGVVAIWKKDTVCSFLKLRLLTFVCCHKILVAGTSNFTSSTMSSLKRLEQKYPSPMMPKILIKPGDYEFPTSYGYILALPGVK